MPPASVYLLTSKHLMINCVPVPLSRRNQVSDVFILAPLSFLYQHPTLICCAKYNREHVLKQELYSINRPPELLWHCLSWGIPLSVGTAPGHSAQASGRNGDSRIPHSLTTASPTHPALQQIQRFRSPRGEGSWVLTAQLTVTSHWVLQFSSACFNSAGRKEQEQQPRCQHKGSSCSTSKQITTWALAQLHPQQICKWHLSQRRWLKSLHEPWETWLGQEILYKETCGLLHLGWNNLMVSPVKRTCTLQQVAGWESWEGAVSVGAMQTMS